MPINKGIVLIVLLATMVISAQVGDDALPARSRPRGFVTTPQELLMVAEKASRNMQPYRAAVDQLLRFAGSPSFWPYDSIHGAQNCIRTRQPEFLGEGSPLVEAKAFAYHLTGDNQYAEAVRDKLLQLTSTSDYGGNNYSGSNQCILNLSWYIPAFIIAADLIEGYRGWSVSDKRSFQSWLGTVVYPKVEWASDVRSNNWGAAGSATSAMIADYAIDYPAGLLTRSGNHITPAEAYRTARRRQIDRFNGNTYMDNYGCPGNRGQGIRPDGGIPWELTRGSSGCDARSIRDTDGSWIYMQTFMQGAVQHAELLLRRGDRSLYENQTAAGAGSLLRAIHFIIENPEGRSMPWKEPNGKQTLEYTYRFYRDSVMASELRFGKRDRYIGVRSDQMLHFGTITHGFAPGENPAPPPTVAPPG